MYKQISANIRGTWLMIFVFLVFVIGVGYFLSVYYDSPVILVVAVLISTTQAIVSWFYSDKIALSTTGAKKTTRSEFLELHRLVENIAITSGIKKPEIYIIIDEAPNAFATGRNPDHASVAVTTGLLKTLNKTELEGVIAHEMSHVKNYDIRLMTVIVVLVGVIALISDFGLRMSFFKSRDENEGGSGIMALIALALYILAPISAMLIQLAISRKREYLADANGALLTRYPEGLASALEKISTYKKPMIVQNRATAHLFMADPGFKKESEQSFFTTIFQTHPPIKERVKRLRDMAI